MKTNSLDRQYQVLIKTILEYGVIKNDRTGTGTKSIFGYTIRHDMKGGFPLLTTKKMSWKQIVTELLWFLSGSTDIRFLWKNNCTIWDGDWYKNYAKSCSSPYTLAEIKEKLTLGGHHFHDSMFDLGPIYGSQWRNWNGRIDQISNLIGEIKKNPDSRRLLVTAWNPTDLEASLLPPCHYGFQVWTRELSWEERVQWVMKNTDVELENLYIVEEAHKSSTPTRAISLMFSMRSTDVPLGLPFNIASYALLLEIFAKSVNMVPDQLIANLADAHIYLNQIEPVSEQIARDHYPLPKVNIPPEFSSAEELNSILAKVEVSDFILKNYESHPAIKIPLSN